LKFYFVCFAFIAIRLPLMLKMQTQMPLKDRRLRFQWSRDCSFRFGFALFFSERFARQHSERLQNVGCFCSIGGSNSFSESFHIRFWVLGFNFYFSLPARQDL